jgi:hypothetical protein
VQVNSLTVEEVDGVSIIVEQPVAEDVIVAGRLLPVTVNLVAFPKAILLVLTLLIEAGPELVPEPEPQAVIESNEIEKIAAVAARDVGQNMNEMFLMVN